MNWELYVAGYYAVRNFQIPRGNATNRIDRVFDIDRLPGFFRRNAHLYNEIALRYDNRPNWKQTSPGLRGEIYLAQKLGTENDSGNLLLSGLDLTAFIKVIHDRRFLVPRTVFSLLYQTDLDEPISFADYPRVLAFRGISAPRLITE